MKLSYLKLAMYSSVIISAMTAHADADNSTIENALRKRPELSMFYEGLISTGVIHELKEGQSYTIFAPTNDAIANFSTDKYPCFYSEQCKAEAAQILRNHIVAGEQHLRDMGLEPGQIDSLFAINSYHLTASEPYKDEFNINGADVLSEHQLLGSVLYRIDGVIATDKEMSEFTRPVMAMVRVPGSDQLLPPRVPEGTIVDITVPMAPEE